ncbi:CHAT domain-containing protein [Amycolatopsis sp. NPDC051102]|uniref:CHAT domain-containing protein n=1 Tax=Amycolatopsis sp. NPDC051102 TaxID=3155163 RepID=UPI00344A0489
MGDPALEAMLTELDRRVMAYGRDQDAGLVLDDPAADLLARVWAQVDAGELTTAAAFVLARFHWCRYLALPEGADLQDQAYALELFTSLLDADPELVPGPLREQLARPGHVPGSAYNSSGAGFYEIYETSGDPEVLDVALGMFAMAVAAAPPEAPQTGSFLANAAGAHLARFGIAGDPADLDAAIGFGLRAVAHPGGSPESRAAAAGNLAAVLRTRFERDGDREDLDAAVDAARRAAELLPPEHPDALSHLAGAALALQTRFQHRHDRTDIDEAVTLAERCVAASAPGDPERPSHLSALANCCFVRYERFRDPADLDVTVEANTTAVRDTPPSRPARLGYLSNLGTALRERYLLTGSLDDLTAGVDAAREAVETAPPGYSDRAALLTNLAALLRTRAARTGGVEDLDAAVAASGQAVEAASGPHRASVLLTHAIALTSRFERTGNPADLDAAVAAGEEAHATGAPDHFDRATWDSDLASALVTRYVNRGDRRDLDTAVRLARRAAAADHPDRGRLLSNLAYTLRIRAAATEDPADFDEAVSAGEEAVASLPDGRPGRSGYLVNLASALAARSERTGSTADLDEAVARSREALTQISEAHADHPGLLNNLGLILSRRFDRLGRLADVDEAVALARRAVDDVPAEHQDRPAYLTNLGTSLRSRHRRTHSAEDLDDAVEVSRAAAAALPPGHTALGGYLSNLGNTLRARFDLAGDPDDLAAALVAAERAVAHAASDVERAQFLSNFSAVLMSAFEHDSAPDRLEAAIAAAEAAVEATPADHADLGRHLANLGNALVARAGPGDLARAVAVTGEAVRVTPAADPDHAGYLLVAGHARRTAEPAAGVPDEWRQAARSATGPAEVRLAAAWAWGDAAAADENVSEAADGFAAAVSLLPVLAWRGLDTAAREGQLWRWAGLASEACAWALRAGDPRRAVELLEQGRSITWSQLTQTRADLTAAREAAPELVDRLAELRSALDAPQRDADTRTVLDRERAASARRRLAEEWDEVLERIRGIDGLRNFLAAAPYDELAAEAAAGPVALVNLSSHRCAAIVVTGGEPIVVDLPGDAQARAVELVNGVLQTRQAAAVNPAFATVRAAHRALAEALSWLHENVVGPVLDALALDAADGQLPRMWWCPTGPLALLPLHAAGDALDRVVSSTLPTIGTLRRSRAAAGAGPVRALVVAQAEARGDLPALPNAEEEARRVRRHLPDGEDLAGPAATADAVLAALAGHTWAHLSCHGSQHPTDPTTSALHLADRPLTVAEIAARTFPGAHLAYLSACETSTGGTRLLDEALHLAGAFQVAGYRHVIATLWTVADDRAVEVAESVYTALLGQGTAAADEVARALHQAVRRLRALVPEAPMLWAPFVHSGP